MVVSKIERLQKELDRAIREGDLELALAVTEDMVDLDPDNSRHHTSKGVILSKLGKVDEAIEELDEAIAIDGEDDRAWYSKGCVLMDDGRLRPALACYYKSLDLEPAMKRTRERFNRCLDQMIREREGSKEEKEIYFERPSLISEDRKDFIEEEDEDEEEEDEGKRVPEVQPAFPERRRKGSYLDEDLFDDEDEEELEEVEEWDEDEEEEFSDWDEDGDEDEDEEEFEDDEFIDEADEEEEEEPVGSIKCRCGSTIYIYSDDRPYRFKCDDCGRKGTLR